MKVLESNQFSKYQKDIFNWIENGSGNAVISAVAGSGKSTTIVNSLQLIPKEDKKIFLAFNKSIVEELSKKVKAPNTEVKTLHSAGFSALIKTYRSRVNNYKYRKFLNDSLFLLSDEITIDFEESIISAYKYKVLKLVDFGRLELCETIQDLEESALRHTLELNYDEAKVAKDLIDWGVKNYREIDFADMLYIPIMKDLNLKTYDWVMIDEAQDLSPLQVKLFLKMINPKTGRFIAVGDRAQSIQFFAGADNKAFDNIANLPNTKEFPLSICYRCDKSIIEKAKKYVPQIEAREGAGEGICQTIKNFNVAKPKGGDMILCRTTAPLVNLCMKFIINNQKAYVKGREIGQNLISLVNQTKQLELSFMFDTLQDELYKLQLKLAEKNNSTLEEAKKEYLYLYTEDKIECLKILAFGCKDTRELNSKILSLFKDTSSGICLSTVHKAKGLGVDRVFIIEPSKMPLKIAAKNEIQLEQEYNIMYVAITRAKKALYIVETEVKDIKLK